MEDTEEVWKDIVDYDEKYEVSSLGNVRNKKTGRILKPVVKGGYLGVGLSNIIEKKNFRVHQLVCKAFIPNIQNKPQINHKDKNKANNNVNNLEWVTAKENNEHRSFGVKQTTNQNLQVYRIDIKTNQILEKYNSIQEASEWLISNNYCDNNTSARGGISCVIRNVYKSSFGFRWEKIEQNSLENEEWREIIINNEKMSDYFVSSLGRFKNKKNVIMNDYKPHHSGYIYVRVNTQKYALHRLVAQTFIPNLQKKPFVNHIDGNKTNNTVNNLEWCTCKENNLHNFKVGLNKGFTRRVAQYDLDMNEIKQFDRIIDASKELQICYGSIKAVLYKKQKTAGGFIWKYLD